MKKITLKPIESFTANLFRNSLILCILFTGSCKLEDRLDVEQDLREFPSDTVLLYDVQLQTVTEERTRTDNIRYHVLGTLDDPNFGLTKASVYSQISLPGATGIPDNAELDDATLYLNIGGYYGDKASKIQLFVHSLDDSIYKKLIYYNDDSIAYRKTLGQAEHSLDQGFIAIDVASIWTEDGFGPGTNFIDNDTFQSQSSGLSISASGLGGDDNTGWLAYIDLFSPQTKLVINYHFYDRVGNSLVKKEETSEYFFGSDTKKFSQITHRQNTDAIKAALHQDSTNSYRAYLQAIAGTNISIQLPEIADLATYPYLALHKAELILPADKELHNSELSVIPFANLMLMGDDDEIFTLPDEAKNYWTYKYDSDLKAYVFNITSYTQDLITQYKRNPSLEAKGLLMTSIKRDDIMFSAGRFIVKGSSLQRQKGGAYLRVFYSEIENP